MAIKALEQEPCDDNPIIGVDCVGNFVRANVISREPCEDAISRRAVLEQINCWIGSGEYRYTNATYYLTERVKHISSIKPQESILDKIRAEIEALPKTYPFMNHIDIYVKEDDVLQIIDKYKAESDSGQQN